MLNYKPQSPLIMNGNGIYPLTTVDQVMMNDGSRLNSAMVTADLGQIENVEDFIPDDLVNADSLGGEPASAYALKTFVQQQIMEEANNLKTSSQTVINIAEKYGIHPYDTYAEDATYDCAIVINQAIQEATAEASTFSGDVLYLPPGKYRTKTPIILNKSVNIQFEGSIEYQGNGGFAVEISNYNHCTAKFHRIRAIEDSQGRWTGGSAVKIYSNDVSNAVIYNQFIFNRLSAVSNTGADGVDSYCIYVETNGTGYVNANRFIGAQCCSGKYGVYVVTNHPEGFGFGANQFDSFSIEGMPAESNVWKNGFQEGFHFQGICWNNTLFNCNLEEMGDGYLKGIVTVGQHNGLKVLNSCSLGRSYMDFSEETTGIILGTMNMKSRIIDYIAYIVRGDVVLDKNKGRYITIDNNYLTQFTDNIVDLTKMTTISGDGYRPDFEEEFGLRYDNEITVFDITTADCAGIKLGRKYGYQNGGINEFCVYYNPELLTAHPDFTITDYQGNVVYTFTSADKYSWSKKFVYVFHNQYVEQGYWRPVEIISSLGNATIGNSEKLEGRTVSDIINLMYPVGSIYTTSINTNPGEQLGGTWELYKKHFSNFHLVQTVESNNKIINFNSSTVNDNGKTEIYRSGDSIHITLDFVHKTAWGDSDVDIGAVNFNNLGITQFPIGHYELAIGDGANNAAMVWITKDGTIKSNDTIPDSLTTGTDYNLVGNYHWIIPDEFKLDEACDEFIWKRIA